MTVTAPSADPRPRRYVFLASNSYSGSTLLSYLLGSHPDIATVSDLSGTRRLGRMDEFRCSCGQLMRTCPYWARVENEARQRGLGDFRLDDFEVGFDHAGPRWLSRLKTRSLRWTTLERIRDIAMRPFGVSRAMAETGRRIWTLAEVMLDLHGAHAFVDASKERMRIRYLERYLPGDLYVIHLVRDVRGVVDSTLRRGKKGLGPLQLARGWARTNVSISRQLREIPAERKMRIRYEDLCADVNGELQRALRLCGVDPSLPLEPIGEGVHLLGNRMRLDSLGEVRLDEGWRERLPQQTQNRILAVAGAAFTDVYGHGARRQGDGGDR